MLDGPVALPDFESAARRAQTWLDKHNTGEDYQIVADRALPNPLQGLWIFSYQPKQGAMLEGGGLAVTADEVREVPSTLAADEYVGVVWPEDEEESEDKEIEAVLALWGDEVEFDSLIQHFGGFDPNQPRAKDGKWNPGGGNDGKEDDKPKSEAERRRILVKAILKSLDDVLDQLSGKQAQALIKRIKENAKAFIAAQDGGPAGGGGGNKGGKGGQDEGKAKESKGDKGGDSGKDGDSGPPGGLEGVIRGVKNLIESFGNNMKNEDRAKLQESVDKLEDLS